MIETIIGIGHISFLVMAINVLHGVDFKCRVIDAGARYLLLAVAVILLAAYVPVKTLPWSEWPEPIHWYGAACLLMSLVIVPRSTLLLALRKRPSGV